MDDIDEFDDEEAFLNLDDVLQGTAGHQGISSLPPGQNLRIPVEYPCNHSGCHLAVSPAMSISRS